MKFKNLLNSLLTTIFVMSLTCCYAQSYRTNYIKQYKIKGCHEENYTFQVYDELIVIIDNYDSTEINCPAKKEITGYTEQGDYYELWSSKFYLNRHGVNEYQKINRYIFKIHYDKRGGKLLLIIAGNDTSGVEGSKFYFTEEGYNKYCN